MANNDTPSLSGHEENKKQKKSKRKLALKMKNDKSDVNVSTSEVVCRICLSEEDTKENPMVTPCICAGTMKHIHIACLRQWLISKRTHRFGNIVKTYCWKSLECELCKTTFPNSVYQEKLGEEIELLDYAIPSSMDYIVLESVTQQNIKIIHVIDFEMNNEVKVGRAHDADIRITDISVSRVHSFIKRNANGDFIVQDNHSKFGTLILLNRPYLLRYNRTNMFQVGRTLVEALIKSPKRSCADILLCRKSLRTPSY